ncbi:hypothetical protein GQR58_026368 [Nymphon striatum]|nr:hypothetical protein GQR58_026368 [Nymphon striatum]
MASFIAIYISGNYSRFHFAIYYAKVLFIFFLPKIFLRVPNDNRENIHLRRGSARDVDGIDIAGQCLQTSLSALNVAAFGSADVTVRIELSVSYESNLSEADQREIEERSAYGLAKFKEWLDKRGKICDYANISATEFNDLLRKFYAEVKATKQTI